MTASRKTYDARYRESHREQRLAYKAAHREQLRVHAAAYNATHREEHHAYYVAHRDERCAYSRAYNAAHSEERRLYEATYGPAYYKAHREERRVYAAAYRAAHREEALDGTHKRRALQRGTAVELVRRSVVFERDHGRCVYCRKKVEPKNWHLAHLIALAAGGEHSYANVAVAHPGCNLTDHTGRLPNVQLRLA